MNISIFGLGYVGCVSLGCMAQDGHTVIGIDVSREKVDMINQGKPTIVEAKIDEIIAEQFKKGRIRATQDYHESVAQTDISIVCVGTPSSAEGHLNLEYIFKVAGQIGESLQAKNNESLSFTIGLTILLAALNDQSCLGLPGIILITLPAAVAKMTKLSSATIEVIIDSFSAATLKTGTSSSARSICKRLSGPLR